MRPGARIEIVLPAEEIVLARVPTFCRLKSPSEEIETPVEPETFAWMVVVPPELANVDSVTAPADAVKLASSVMAPSAAITMPFAPVMGALLFMVTPLPERAVSTTCPPDEERDRKSTRLNSSHTVISYAVF